MMPRMSIEVALIAVLAAPLQAQNASDSPLQLAHLGLELTIDYAKGTIGGAATMRLRNVTGLSAPVVPLLLNRLMQVSRVVDSAGREMRFTQDVVTFADDPARQVAAVSITPDTPVASGDSITIVVHYAGILTGYTETGSLYIRDRVRRDFTIIREDAFAFPVSGVASWRVNRAAPRDEFSWAAHITVPVGLVVAAPGPRGRRTVRDSLVTWSYSGESSVPFLNIAVAPYRVLESEGSRIFHFPVDSTGARMVQRGVGDALVRFANWYGPLTGAPRVVVMEIPEGFGSQASLAAGIIQTADAFRDRAQLRQLYHELSHLWNVTDLDVPSPRWNEGLATFLQWRMAAELDGWSDWNARIDRTVQNLRQRCAVSGCDSLPLIEYGRAGLTDLSYSVGFLLFYALHETLGSAPFDRIYRSFLQRYGSSGATTLDLVAAFRSAGPRADRILSDWLLTANWYARLSSGESWGQMLASYRP